MTATVRRIMSSCFVLALTLAGLAIPATAQAQYGQQRVAEGSHVWGNDDWCYVVRGGRLVRTSYFRVFPDPTNRRVFNIYQNGRFLRRVGASSRPTARQQQTRNPEAEFQRLIDQLNQLTASAPRAGVPRDRGTMAFCPQMSGPYVATNVRASIPMYGCQTPEEKAWQARSIGDRQNAEAIRRLGACQRASQPYRGERQAPNGVMLYRLDDGSEQPRGGTLNQGWMWGLNGMPQPKAGCF